MKTNALERKTIIGKLVESILPRRTGSVTGFRPLDFGVLKVAMMIAAIDGNVIEREIAMFKKLARKCRGWTPEAAEKALKEGLRSAGYLALQAKRLGERALIAEFINEAMEALPEDFAASYIGDLRRAFVMWSAMAVSDRRFSVVERKAVLALRKRLGIVDIVPDRFIREVEMQFRSLGHEETVMNAVHMLRAFIEIDEV